MEGLGEAIGSRLAAMQRELFEAALAFRQANTRVAADWRTFERTMTEQAGFVVSGWCGGSGCEREIQAETGATLRVLPFDGELDGLDASDSCVRCGRAAIQSAVFARAY